MNEQQVLQQLSSIDYSQWSAQAFALIVTAILIPGLRVRGIISAMLTVIVLSLINTKVWDAALFFKIPDTLTIQAFTLILVNGTIFWVVVKLMPGISVNGITPALLAPLVFTISSVLISEYFSEINWSEVYTAVKNFLGPIKNQFLGSSSLPGS